VGKSSVPAVSILLPCYNAVSTLDEALESIASQTLDDYEVVAVDDGSTDGSLQLLNDWASRDRRVHIISRKHGGIIPSLNAGLNACQAEIVARMDADDRSHPERLAEQVGYLDRHPEVAVVSCLVSGFPQEQVREGFRIYIEWLNSLVTDEQIKREIFVESPLAHPSVAFRKAQIMQLGGYQEVIWPEDYDLWLRLNLAAANFAKVPRTLFEWREDPGRLTRLDSRYSLENFLRAKAYYLAQGPLRGRDGVILWGAGMMGRRLSKHLIRHDCPLVAFIDIDPRKIGSTRRGLPILSPEDLPAWWSRYVDPVLLVAVGARGARAILRERIELLELREARDWWFVA
jgi:glycosyltransferase involved in cell wall biosynthesis